MKVYRPTPFTIETLEVFSYKGGTEHYYYFTPSDQGEDRTPSQISRMEVLEDYSMAVSWAIHLNKQRIAKALEEIRQLKASPYYMP